MQQARRDAAIRSPHKRPGEKALVLNLGEMYVQGVSTRKVKAITGQLCGHKFSAVSIHRTNKKPDAKLDKSERRKLEEPYPYLILDARYEKVQDEGLIRRRAALIGIGITDNSGAVCRRGSCESRVIIQLVGLFGRPAQKRIERRVAMHILTGEEIELIEQWLDGLSELSGQFHLIDSVDKSVQPVRLTV